MLAMVNRSKAPDRYQPLVQMAVEMSRETGAPAQTHFDSLLALLRGPTRLRRVLWCADRNRGTVILIAMAGAMVGARFAI